MDRKIIRKEKTKRKEDREEKEDDEEDSSWTGVEDVLSKLLSGIFSRTQSEIATNAQHFFQPCFLNFHSTYRNDNIAYKKGIRGPLAKLTSI